MSATEQKTVTLDVRYESSEPSEIEYFHNTFGMMKFDVEGATAVLDDEWDRLGDRYLKDGYTRWVTTGDVLRSVERLPFIDSVVVMDRSVDTDTDRSGGDGQ